jgi:hypothetical protein
MRLSTFSALRRDLEQDKLHVVWTKLAVGYPGIR